jgi:hypothetical protein
MHGDAEKCKVVPWFGKVAKSLLIPLPQRETAMAMRYTDTTKWDDDWFLGLSPRFKCAWSWLCDKYDGAGFVKVSFKKLTDEIGEEITRDAFNAAFAERVVWIKSDVVWVFGAIKAQHKKGLSRRNNAHMNIARMAVRELSSIQLPIKAISVFNALIELIEQPAPEPRTESERSSSDTRPSDKDNDKDNVKDKENTNTGGVGENPPKPNHVHLFEKRFKDADEIRVLEAWLEKSGFGKQLHRRAVKILDHYSTTETFVEAVDALGKKYEGLADKSITKLNYTIGAVINAVEGRK